ncbi:MAG: hypothetical protein IJA86_09715 [Clostridia bacterium]|nr:hypothetical protein [Clostridia bacterium]
MKKFLSVFLVVITMALILTSCMSADPKDFTVDGMTVTLTTAFKETEMEGYTACYTSKDVLAVVLKEIGMDNLTLDDYAGLVRKANASKNPSEISKGDVYHSMEYDFLNQEENQTYSYYCAMFKNGDEFWLVQFACRKEDYTSHKETFINWANTVKFAN